MQRNKFILQLAKENKFGYVCDEGLSITNISDSSANSSLEMSPIHSKKNEENFDKSPLQETIGVQSNVSLKTPKETLISEGKRVRTEKSTSNKLAFMNDKENFAPLKPGEDIQESSLRNEGQTENDDNINIVFAEPVDVYTVSLGQPNESFTFTLEPLIQSNVLLKTPEETLLSDGKRDRTKKSTSDKLAFVNDKENFAPLKPGEDIQESSSRNEGQTENDDNINTVFAEPVDVNTVSLGQPNESFTFSLEPLIQSNVLLKTPEETLLSDGKRDRTEKSTSDKLAFVNDKENFAPLKPGKDIQESSSRNEGQTENDDNINTVFAEPVDVNTVSLGQPNESFTFSLEPLIQSNVLLKTPEETLLSDGKRDRTEKSTSDKLAFVNDKENFAPLKPGEDIQENSLRNEGQTENDYNIDTVFAEHVDINPVSLGQSNESFTFTIEPLLNENNCTNISPFSFNCSFLNETEEESDINDTVYENVNNEESFLDEPVCKSNFDIQADDAELTTKTINFNQPASLKSHSNAKTTFSKMNLEETETNFDQYLDFSSSGSEYIPSDDVDSSDDGANCLNGYNSKNLKQVTKTYSKTNLIERETTVSKKFIADNKEADINEAIYVKENQNPDRAGETPILSLRSNLKSEIIPNIENKYIKKPSARERPTICTICYQDVPTHFPRHLFRHHNDHEDVQKIQNLKPGSSERQNMISTFRKQGYFHLNTEKKVMIPVRTSKDPSTEYFVCTYCLGHYNKNLLYKHVKICKNKPSDSPNSGRNCLSKSQTFMASRNQEFLKTFRLKNEVFNLMRPDNISEVAKNDPLICLYGESLLARHKRQQIATVISNKVREMARLLIKIKSMDNRVNSFFDALKPEMFGLLLSATKDISGYTEKTKSYKVPSLALHMGTNLKLMCNVAFKIIIEKKKCFKINWSDRDRAKADIKDLKKLIEGHWGNEISGLALKTLKERQWENRVQLPLTSDILLFQTFVNDLANNAYENLNIKKDIKKNYKVLTECVFAHTVMFNRKRVGDVQYLKIETYIRENNTLDQDAFTDSLTTVEKILSKKFKRVVTDGKGSRPVPILFSPKIQKYISCLLDIRKNSDIVPTSNPYLFANPNSQFRWMEGTKVIRCLGVNWGAKYPKLLTSTKFRKHIATTLQLMTMQEDEMEQIATFMGHTKKTHTEFYRLPQDIYQTAKVAKVLLLLEKGRGKEFRGKSLNEIELEKDVYYSSESDEDLPEESIIKKSSKENKPHTQTSNAISFDDDLGGTSNLNFPNSECTFAEVPQNTNIPQETELCKEKENPDNSKNVTKIGQKRKRKSGSDEKREIKKPKKSRSKKSSKGRCSEENKDISEVNLHKPEKALKPLQGRIRWSTEEKELALKYFKSHIKSKITPKKHECDEFIKKYEKRLRNKNWVKVKTFVYNYFRVT